MSDDSPKVDGRGKSPGSLANLRPATSETAKNLNPNGRNGWDKRRRALIDFLNGKSADAEKTRIEKVMLATYTNSLTPKGGMDRKLLNEQYFGKARQPLDLTSSDHSMSPSRKPTTAEARQELDAILSALDERAPGVAAGVETADKTEGEAAADPEPKAGP